MLFTKNQVILKMNLQITIIYIIMNIENKCVVCFMNIYKVYIKDNEEYFQVWDNKGETLITEYHDFFPRALCDYIYMHEEFIGTIADLIGSAYHYMNAVNQGKITEVYPPHKEMMQFGRLFMFIQDQKESWFNEGYNSEYLNSTWFDYPILKTGNYKQPEIQRIMIEEYNIIKAYFSAIMNGDAPKDIEWERTTTTKLESIDGKMCQVLYPKHTSDVIYYLFSEMSKRDILFKKCKRCEKIFPCYYHKNVQFCERLDESRNETCRKIKFSHLGGANDMADDDTRQIVLDIYEKAYKRQRGRVDYGSLDKTKFKIWSKKARKRRDLCLKEALSIREFEEWIKENDWNYEEE